MWWEGTVHWQKNECMRYNSQLPIVEWSPAINAHNSRWICVIAGQKQKLERYKEGGDAERTNGITYWEKLSKNLSVLGWEHHKPKFSSLLHIGLWISGFRSDIWSFRTVKWRTDNVIKLNDRLETLINWADSLAERNSTWEGRKHTAEFIWNRRWHNWLWQAMGFSNTKRETDAHQICRTTNHRDADRSDFKQFTIYLLQPDLNHWEREWMENPFRNHMSIRRNFFVDQDEQKGIGYANRETGRVLPGNVCPFIRIGDIPSTAMNFDHELGLRVSSIKM